MRILLLGLIILNGCVGAPHSVIIPPPNGKPVVATPAVDPQSNGECCAKTWKTKPRKKDFSMKLTAYFPDNSQMEGGFHNRYSEPLSTLQAQIAGKKPYTSVAMDQNLGRVKRRLCSNELSDFYGKELNFLVDDTGGAFKGKGYTRADICVENRKESFKSILNRKVNFSECE